MDLQLKDKVVVITGGAKGIGAAITRGCAQEGAVTIIIDKDSRAGEQMESELHSSGGRCETIFGDLTRGEVCEAAVVDIQREFGRIDSLVNNAGVNDSIGLEHGTPEKFVGSLQLNL